MYVFMGLSLLWLHFHIIELHTLITTPSDVVYSRWSVISHEGSRLLCCGYWERYVHVHVVLVFDQLVWSECANAHRMHNPICGLQATQGVTLVRFRSMKGNTLPSPSYSSMLSVLVVCRLCNTIC